MPASFSPGRSVYGFTWQKTCWQPEAAHPPRKEVEMGLQPDFINLLHSFQQMEFLTLD